ncbi:hypothetical protein TNCV_3041631 [Trichonephila clavipes]|nr:hypothetical protein TNCV_3041631 [Trichonephila clavipes]
MSELEENQLLGQMDNKQLKAKIKSIKDVYRTELNKIEKSKKSGCGVDDVYVPKLTWFNEACFPGEVFGNKKRSIKFCPSFSHCQGRGFSSVKYFMNCCLICIAVLFGLLLPSEVTGRKVLACNLH